MNHGTKYLCGILPLLFVVLCLSLWLIWQEGKTWKPSLQSRIFDKLMVWFGIRSWMNHLANAQEIHEKEEIDRSLLTAWHPPTADDLCVQKSLVGGGVLWSIQEKCCVSTRERQQHIVYVPGGAYVLGVTLFHWGLIHHLVRSLKCHMTVVLYPLAPEHKYPEAFSMLDTVYTDLLKRHGDQEFIFMGDSAGGGILYSYYEQLTLRAKSRLPERLYLLSPWLDASMTHPCLAESQLIQRHDPLITINAAVICGKLFCEDNEKVRDTPLCPLFKRLPRVPNELVVVTGTRDILCPQAQALVDELKENEGYDATLIKYEELPHDFILFDWLPEAIEVRERLIHLLLS